MKKLNSLLPWMFIAAFAVTFALLMAMGVEIFNRMRPEVISGQAYALVVSNAVMFACLLYKVWASKK